MRTSAPRARPSFSCILCRQRRVKCDRAKPACGNCVKAKVVCEWHPSAGVNGGALVAQAQQKLEQSAGLKRQRIDEGDSSDSPVYTSLGANTSAFAAKSSGGAVAIPTTISEYPNNPLPPAVDVRELELRVNKLTQLLGTLGYSSDVIGPTKEGSLGPRAEGKGPGGVDGQVWNYILEEVKDLNSTLRKNGSSNGISNGFPHSLLHENVQNAAIALQKTQSNLSLVDNLTENDVELKLNPTVDVNVTSEGMRKLVREIPNRFQSNLLWLNFINCVYPTMPIYHLPDILRWYRRFWDIRESNGGSLMPLVEDCPEFFVVFFSALYSGAKAARAEDLNELFTVRVSRVDLLDRLMGAMQNALKEVNFDTNPTVLGLAAIITSHGCADEADPASETNFVLGIKKKVYALGLHQSPRGKNLSVIDQEVRRRLWWTTYGIDVNRAVLNGSPLIFTEDDAYDYSFPSQLKDEYLEYRDNPDYTRNDMNYDPCKIAANARYESVLTFRNIIRTLQRVDRFNLAEIEKLGLMVYEFRRSCMRMMQRINRMRAFIKDPREVTFMRWTGIFVSSMSDRAMCTLYQPFLKGSKCSLWPYSRTCALRSAHNLIRKTIFVAIIPEYEAIYRAYRSWHFPIQAAIILLVDLYVRPQSFEARHSRVLLDKIFKMVSEKESRVNRVAYRWNLLRKLRRQAYKRAGINVDNPRYLRQSEESLREVLQAIDGKIDPMYACPAEISLADEDFELPIASTESSHESGHGSPSTPSTNNGFTSVEIVNENPVPGLDDMDRIVTGDYSNTVQPGFSFCDMHVPVPSNPIDVQGFQQTSSSPSTVETTPNFDSLAYGDFGAAGMPQVQNLQQMQEQEFQWNEWDEMFGDFMNVDIDETYIATSDFFQGKVSEFV